MSIFRINLYLYKFIKFIKYFIEQKLLVKYFKKFLNI